MKEKKKSQGPWGKTWNFQLTEDGIKEALRQGSVGYTEEQLAKLDDNALEDIADKAQDFIDNEIFTFYRMAANDFREENNLEDELPELVAEELHGETW
jgi:hypothetical protein